MHYFFLDESYPPAAPGQKKIVMAAWAVEQRLWNWNRNTVNGFGLFKAPVLKPICSMLESEGGAAFAGVASLDDSLYRAGEIDSTNDIPAMKRPDLIWSMSAVFVLGTLILKLLQHRREIGTVDIHFDSKNLKWAHSEAWKRTLRELVVKSAKRFAWERSLGQLNKLNIRRIEPVAKSDHLGDVRDKFQMGVWIADKLCSNFDQIESLKCPRISSFNMSESVQRTAQQWEGKSFYEPPMSEPSRNETQLGIAELKKRLGAAGLNIVRQQENFRHRTTYFAIGDTENQTDVALSEEFLDDLPNTEEYQAMVESYALAVAGRLKCGSPELFYCESGVGVQVSFRWPIHGGFQSGGEYKAVLLMDVTNRIDGKTAKCSVEVGGGRVPAVLVQVVNDLRSAIDAGQIQFYEPTVHQETFQRVETKPKAQEPRSQSDVERFVAGKAYTLGFLAAHDTTEVWAVDPWDAQYLGVTNKALSLAMRVLRARELLQAGTGPDYVRPTDKLLAEHSSRAKEGASLAQPQQKLSRNSPPAKDALLKELQRLIAQHPTFAIVLLDVDNFKKVNDTNGHPAGDACLDKFIGAVEAVVGQRGRLFRWGGDEFAICLPDFSTAEAMTTAERIRSAVQRAKAGGDIEVTTSIGVCGSDRTESRSPEELFDFADKAMYHSKHSGRNRVTAWPLSSETVVENTPAKRLSEQERRKLADSVVISIKTDNSHQRNYTIQIKNHSKELEVSIMRISLWKDDERIGNPVFRPKGENARCWDVGADRELPFNFDAGEVVAKRLWTIAGSPSMDSFHDNNLLMGHFRSKVRVEVLYAVLGIEKQYEETRTVQVDPINNAITGI